MHILFGILLESYITSCGDSNDSKVNSLTPPHHCPWMSEIRRLDCGRTRSFLNGCTELIVRIKFFFIWDFKIHWNHDILRVVSCTWSTSTDQQSVSHNASLLQLNLWLLFAASSILTLFHLFRALLITFAASAELQGCLNQRYCVFLLHRFLVERVQSQLYCCFCMLVPCR